MSTAVPVPEAPEAGKPLTERLLDGIERIGNKVPHPAILFIGLCVVTILLSQVLYWLDISVTSEVVQPPPAEVEQRYDGGSVLPSEVLPYQPASPEEYRVVEETAAIQGLLTGDGIRFLFTSFVANFLGFTAVGVILVAMVGVGLAESSGLIGALIRKLVGVSSPSSLVYIIVFAGIISSVASDAGYLVLIPLGAAAFASVGRNPVAGIAAAFAGVSAAFGVNFLITPVDGVITGITNEAAQLVRPDVSLDLTANLYFGAASVVFLTVAVTLITTRIIEPRLGAYDPALASDEVEDEAPEVAPDVEARGLRAAGLAVLAVIVLIVLLTVIPGAPLRNPETGDVIGDSPFMDSLIVIISLIFLVAGLAYGRVVGTVRNATEAIGHVTKAWAGLAGLLFLFLLIAQFIAYFDFSNMAQVAAVNLGDLLVQFDIGGGWLLLFFMVVAMVVNLIIPSVIAKWAILAPIFIPLLLRLGVEPQTVLAAYRVADSPTNVITPLMVYFPLIVVFVKRYDRTSGIGTVIAVMLPYALILTVAWTAFFMLWYVLGITLGPGSPV